MLPLLPLALVFFGLMQIAEIPVSAPEFTIACASLSYQNPHEELLVVDDTSITLEELLGLTPAACTASSGIIDPSASIEQSMNRSYSNWLLYRA